jgi:hypothetical protein
MGNSVTQKEIFFCSLYYHSATNLIQMRKILIILLLAPIITFSQKVKTIAELESFFKETARHNIKYGGQLCGSQELNKLFDSLLPTIFNKPVPNKYWDLYWPYYSSDATFKQIIAAIDSLAITPESFTSSIITHLKNRISNLPHQGLRAYAATHLINRVYTSQIDTSLILATQVFFTIVDSSLTEPFTLTQVAEKLSALASTYICLSDMDGALELYLGAEMFADSSKNLTLKARIEEQIGDFYMRRNMGVYKRKAADHYIEASNRFLEDRNYTSFSIARLKGSRLRFASPYGPSLLETVAKRKTKKPYEELLDSLWGTKFDEASSLLLRTAYQSFNKPNERENNFCAFQIYSSLGQYFESTNDLKTAKIYTLLALLSLTASWENIEISDFILTLRQLAHQYELMELEDTALKYYDTAIRIASWFEQKALEVESILDKARFLFVINQSDAALALAKEQFVFVDELPLQDQDNISSAINETVYKIYDQLVGSSTNWTTIDSLRRKSSFYDSAKSYYQQYKSNQADYIDELEMMANKEMDYQTDRFDKKVRDVNKILSETNLLLSSTQTEVRQRKKELQILNGTLAVKDQTLASKLTLIDSLNNIKKTLDAEIANRKEEIKGLESESKEKDREIHNKTLSLIYVSIAFAVLFYSGLSIYKYRIKKKDHKIKDTRDELTSIAKRRIHNNKSNFSRLTQYLMIEEYNTAFKYLERCKDVFSLLLEKWNWEENKYTLQDEWDLVLASYEIEKVNGAIVTIDRDFTEIEPKETLFMPEILTMLLENSIKHGFKEKKDNCHFKVKAERHGDFIFFTVSDNGIPRERERYFVKNLPHKGFALVKQRILNILENRKNIPRGIEKFCLDLNQGTTIQFIFPYEVSPKDAPRRG